MKRKHKRLAILAAGGVGLAIAAALVLTAFQDNIVFFRTPTDLVEKKVPTDGRLRIGGLVEAGSVKKGADGVTVQFRVTDTANSVAVHYRGILPDLFREGQGVVAEGRYRNDVFEASEVLAKHDENYMPKEVVEALKRSGEWKGGAQGAAPGTAAAANPSKGMIR